MFEVIGYQLAEIHLQQMAWISKWENITSMFGTLKKKIHHSYNKRNEN